MSSITYDVCGCKELLRKENHNFFDKREMKWCVKKYGGFSYEELDWGCEQYKKTGIE
jgi:hypothetical protein